jgi:hypothetical protein
VDEPHVDTRVADALTAPRQRSIDDVDAGDLPAPLCELDGPDGAAGAKVERAPEGRFLTLLLPGEQR